MVKIKRGNVVLKVKPEDVPRYFAMGYDVFNENGDIVKRATPTTIKELQEQLNSAKIEIETMRSEIAELLAKLEEAEQPKVSKKKSEKKK